MYNPPATLTHSDKEPHMPGGANAVSNGAELKRAVAALGKKLGLDAETEVKVGRRIWGSQRYIDVVLTDPSKRLRLGIECKFQGTPGTAEEKIPATIEDIAAWPIKGIIVIAGPGFSQNMQGYLISTGKVVEFDDLEDWLTLYYGL